MCEKPGHLGRNCLDADKVRGSGPKPPGHTGPSSSRPVMSASIGIDYDAIERHRKAAEKSAIRLNAVGLDLTSSGSNRNENSNIINYNTQELCIELAGVQIKQGNYAAVQRNASKPSDPARRLPKPLVIKAEVNGHVCRALIDSGSLADFMLSTLADQLRVKRQILAKPLPLQLAVQGSRSRINAGCVVRFKYQNIDTEKYFDIANLQSYDLILGTPFLFQHHVQFSFHPAVVYIGSDKLLPLEGEHMTIVESRAAELYQEGIDQVRQELIEYCKPLCAKAEDTALPPLRDINHTIPLIDEKKIYPWRPSRCPDAFWALWDAKRDAYLRSGRWKVTTSGNTMPMLFIPKPCKEGEPVRLRTVVDLRARNTNTHKMSAPLPDIEGILRRASRARYRSLIDGQDAYEQIRIIPEHVERSAVTTPDGNMVSLVIQQGDCNAPATYQALMNHIFGPYIGKFVDVYLDDIIVYSNTLAEHVEHVKIVVDILRRERLFLSRNKLHFLENELKILGRVVDDDGIKMDPHKVDAIEKWKVPTNRDLLRGFLGSVVFLAGDLANIARDMATLSKLTGDVSVFRWGATEQRAFENIKFTVGAMREHHRRPLDYSAEAQPIWVATDASAKGVSGVVSQGLNWKSATVAAFFSAKMTPAQENYPVHEQELLAGVETMWRHRDILRGVFFTWITDHKGLVHLFTQSDLSGRQARWMEKLSEFDFEVKYIPGEENIFPDALSRLYTADTPDTVRYASEYTYSDWEAVEPTALDRALVAMPVLVGEEGRWSSPCLRGRPEPTKGPDAGALVPARKGKRKSGTGRPAQKRKDSPPANQEVNPGRKKASPRTPVPPAETGRPETGREFAQRVLTHGKFVLRGPRRPEEQTKGGMEEITPPADNDNQPSVEPAVDLISNNTDEDPLEKKKIKLITARQRLGQARIRKN
jgi:hypothetical protein